MGYCYQDSRWHGKVKPIARFLHKKGADYPLQLALCFDDVQRVGALVKQSNAVEVERRAPMHQKDPDLIFTNVRSVRMARYLHKLLGGGNDVYGLMVAARLGDLQRVKALVKAGKNINEIHLIGQMNGRRFVFVYRTLRCKRAQADP